MANYNVLLALCWVVTMEMCLLGASSHLIVMPPAFDLVTGPALTVNCTFDYSHASNVSNLVSILIGKRDVWRQENSKFTDMVSVTYFAPNVVNMLTPVDASVSGHVSKDGPSFLSLRWEHPSLTEEGFYYCLVTGLDARGRCVETTHISQVTARVPNSLQQIESARRQEMIIQDLHHKMNQTSSTLDLLLTSHTSSEAELKRLSDSVNNFKLESSSRLWILLKYQMSNFYNGSRYLLSTEKNINTNSSQEKCALVGGYLAEIDNSAENSFIKSFLDSSTSLNDDVMIGGTDEATDGQWVWKNSQRPLSFTDWEQNQPNGGKVENCLFLWKSNAWKWRDEKCKASYPFLCEVTPN